MSEAGRKMIYPYTTAQRLMFFPWKFMWKHMPMFKFIFYAAAFGGAPVFYQLQKLSYSPSNVEKYERYLKKEEEERHAHLHHLEGFNGGHHH